MNLHDALMAAGRARRERQPEVFQSGAEASCFDQLSEAERAGWNLAIDYYAELVTPGRFLERHQLLPRLAILWGEDDWAEPEERRFIAISESLRRAAAPAYEACRWSAQDSRNRRWIDEIVTLLSAHEEAISRRLSELYGTTWASLPLPVDVVETVSWSGGNSVALNPPPGHILISSTNEGYQDEAGLEMVFHEASHFLMLYDSPLRDSLDAAAARNDAALPRLWHAVLFFTTGEVVRRVLEGAGESDYRPFIYAQGLYEDGLRGAIESAWLPYIDRGRSLSESAYELVESLSSPESVR